MARDYNHIFEKYNRARDAEAEAQLRERHQQQEDRLYMRRARGEISPEEFQRRLAECETRFDRVDFHQKIARRLKRGV